jgi:hypothetical protein
LIKKRGFNAFICAAAFDLRAAVSMYVGLAVWFTQSFREVITKHFRRMTGVGRKCSFSGRAAIKRIGILVACPLFEMIGWQATQA